MTIYTDNLIYIKYIRLALYSTSLLVNFRSQGSKCDIPVIPPISDATSTDVQDTNNIQTIIIDSGASEDSTNVDSNTNNDTAVDTTDITEGDKPRDECCETLNENVNAVDLAENVATELLLNKEETVSTQVADGLSKITECGCPEGTDITLKEDCNPTGNNL